jgi:hypothetical protein
MYGLIDFRIDLRPASLGCLNVLTMETHMTAATLAINNLLLQASLGA